MAHRKWRETKQLPSLLPGPAVPGCSLIPFHFLWAILCPQTVDTECIHLLGFASLKLYFEFHKTPNFSLCKEVNHYRPTLPFKQCLLRACQFLFPLHREQRNSLFSA